MKTKLLSPALITLLMATAAHAQKGVFQYHLEISPYQSDAFRVTVDPPRLSSSDSIYSFVSFAPGVHQPLDFGRFLRSLKVLDEAGAELAIQKISTNDWRILQPERVGSIVYEIDDSFDMDVKKHPIYPMSGTGITDDYAIVNSHGVFGYFEQLKSNPVNLSVSYPEEWTIGTALDKGVDGIYHADSYYHLVDSPILVGDLSEAALRIGDIDVEAFVYSPVEEINATRVLELSKPVLESIFAFIGYAPVSRYTFLMYFSSREQVEKAPALRAGGALEHSYSSTYALPALPQHIHLLKDVVAHEFLHILTPLHLRSEIIAEFDFSEPTSADQHLWLYEGVTEWAAHISQLRSGDISLDEYLGRITDKISSAERYGTEYSLARLSAEWSTDEGNRKYGNIYQLGALTAGALDIKLLQLSSGERGLRDVYLELIERYGKDRPFSNADFFDELVAITYPEIGDFIERHIRSAEPLDFADDFASLGITYWPERAAPESAPSMGLSLGGHGDKVVIAGFSEDHVEIGLQEGDVIEEMFGVPVSLENLQEVLARKEQMAAGDTYGIIVSRGGERMQFEGQLVGSIERHVLEVDATASPEAIELRRIWTSNR